MIKEQSLGTADEDKIGYATYTFLRTSNQPTESTIHGRGSPSKRCGLVKSSFRPSDDACLLPFNIPGNAMLSVALNRTANMLKELNIATEIAKECQNRSEGIREAIFRHGVVRNSLNEKVFAYEIDGFGSHILMDDANIPSLLSLPFLNFIDKNDPIYKATRRYVLSENNPYYYSGKAGYGVGGPHNGDGWVWPMAIIVQALTSGDDEEIVRCLRQLLTTTAGTNFMHESFWRDNAEKYSRKWFAWANTLFGELVLTLKKERPEILKEFQL